MQGRRNHRRNVLLRLAIPIVGVGLIGGCEGFTIQDLIALLRGDTTTTTPLATVDVNVVGLGRVKQTEDGTNQILEAIAADGWSFVGWSDADVPANENPTTVDPTVVTSITVTFEEIVTPPPVADADNDGTPDSDDNCPKTANADQADGDGDGVGDVCDNCVDIANADQADADRDNVGDACEDSDGDGVPDLQDNCPFLANSDQADDNSDGVGNACDNDVDSDGVADDTDNCLNTPNADQADADGDGLGDACDDCPLDAENDVDNDGVCGDVDQCNNTPAGSAVGSNGCPPTGPVTPPPAGSVCGNGTVESGEQCDDGNTVSGDGCSSACQVEISTSNDNCATPLAVADGVTNFDTTTATTDGIGSNTCNIFGNNQIVSDIWFTYAPTCSAGETVVVSLCGSEYDTKLAVYAGTTCPTPEPIRCSDDDCGSGASDSRLSFTVTAGTTYLIRVGGYAGADQAGIGTLNVSCGESPCGPSATGDCFTARPNETGCDGTGSPVPDCCSVVCGADPFCCDVSWDSVCATEANGLCSSTGFLTCGAGSGSCDTANGSPGCDDSGSGCCNSVCQTDPFCCVNSWDDICAATAAGVCAGTCGPDAGSCTLAAGNGTPGCEKQACCDSICAEDPFCCQTEWDDTCAAKAADSTHLNICR